MKLNPAHKREYKITEECINWIKNGMPRLTEAQRLNMVIHRDFLKQGKFMEWDWVWVGSGILEEKDLRLVVRQGDRLIMMSPDRNIEELNESAEILGSDTQENWILKLRRLRELHNKFGGRK